MEDQPRRYEADKPVEVLGDAQIGGAVADFVEIVEERLVRHLLHLDVSGIDLVLQHDLLLVGEVLVGVVEQGVHGCIQLLVVLVAGRDVVRDLAQHDEQLLVL
ncbi:hypothetical protein D3C81_1463880 [compost metagenome]